MLTALRTERVRLFNSVNNLQIRHVSLNTAISRGKRQGENSGSSFSRRPWAGRGSQDVRKWKEDGNDGGRHGDGVSGRRRFGDRDGDRKGFGGGFKDRYQNRGRGERDMVEYGGSRDGGRDGTQFGRRDRDGDRFRNRNGERHTKHELEIAKRMRTDRMRWKPGMNEDGEDASRRGRSKTWDGKATTRSKAVAYNTIQRNEAEMDPWVRALRNKGLRPAAPPRPKYQSTEDNYDYTKNAEYQPGDGRVRHKFGLVGPKSIPYTNAAAEFIYGTSAVQSAIKCGRRKLYTLYIYDDGVNKHISQTLWEDPLMKQLHKLALMAGARVRLVKGTWDKTMDMMSGGRPHNGVILEASPLPKLPGISFQRVESPSASHITVDLAQQPPEEAEVNGTDGRIQRAAHKSGLGTSNRYPLAILLDGILDPGNLGGIIRSAHYLGVDAIAFSSKNSASLTPVTLKASAGAAESIPLISIQDTRSFIDRSQHNGWRFFAAEAPGSDSQKGRTRADKQDPESKSKPERPFFVTSQLAAELYKSPCVVMLGSEGSGLSRKLSAMADAFVAVPGVYAGNVEDDAGVDSLNVSVASALLCEAFLREEGVNPLQSRINAELHAAPAMEEGEVGEEDDDNKVF